MVKVTKMSLDLRQDPEFFQLNPKYNPPALIHDTFVSFLYFYIFLISLLFWCFGFFIFQFLDLDEK